MSVQRFLKLEEALELLNILDSDESDVEIAVLPPDASELTDEDEGDDTEVNTGEIVVNDVPGTLEVRVGDSVETEASTSAGVSTTKRRRKAEKYQSSWIKTKSPQYSKWKTQVDSTANDLLKHMETTLKEKSPVELFEQFYSNEVYDHIVKETVRYATDVKNEHDFLTSADEIRVFLGILLLTGYHSNTCERDYWSDAEDLGITLVKNAMSRNRFQKLKSYLHFVDNSTVSQHPEDRSFKVKPLFAMLNNNFMKFGHFSANLSIDEMIIMYYGRNSLKQFIRGKPIRFGYKLWALCGSEGYCYNFSLYCGKEFHARKDTPLGTRVVMKLIENIGNPSGYTLYFDNFFTSIDLLKSLGEEGYRATGTIRENRINRECPLEEPKSMRKKERGTCDFAYDKNSEILLVRWNDNSIVTTATNFSTLEPFFDVKRRVKGHKDKINVKMPNLINSYNKHMGGVDHHDWLAGLYAVKIRGKKWYWPLFIRTLDMAVVNAWIMHKAVNKSDALNLKEFRRAITTVYLKKSTNRTKGRPRIFSMPSSAEDDVRKDGVGHFLLKREKQRRCQREDCKGKPKTYCGKCDKTLCQACFGPFHQV